MGIFPFLRRENPPESSLTFDFAVDEPSRGYLKIMALETVVGFIAKAMASSEFRHSVGRFREYGEINYLLNVRPNADQTAYQFWFDFFFRLIAKGEVLVIKSDDGDLLIADYFERVEYAVFPDTFTGVTVKDFTFQRNFYMNEVIYLKHGNERLNLYLDGMFADYTELFNRMISVQLRSNQIRAIVGIDSSQSLDATKQAKIQEFINNLFKSFRDKSIAIIPKLKGFDYEEVSSGENNSRSIDELTKLKSSLVNEVADILGVPQGLLHGDIAELDSQMKAFQKFCILPLSKLVEDELNVKVIGKEDYFAGERIKLYNPLGSDVTERATAVDKLISSGAYTRNEIRVKFGDEPSEDAELDKYVITKNYEVLGGEEVETNEDLR